MRATFIVRCGCVLCRILRKPFVRHTNRPWIAAWRVGTSRRMAVRRAMNAQRFFFLKMRPQRGLLLSTVIMKQRTQGEIIQLWVAPHLQGHWVRGWRLQRLCWNGRRATTFSRAVADVFEHNKRSCGLFLKLGFCPTDDPAHQERWPSNFNQAAHRRRKRCCRETTNCVGLWRGLPTAPLSRPQVSRVICGLRPPFFLET